MNVTMGYCVKYIEDEDKLNSLMTDLQCCHWWQKCCLVETAVSWGSKIAYN
jgi:hypothetical protein